ncbi:hypothetical protein PLICRDRAFT_700923 [Plicaturopsis crispa FD-325 SS-3]|nr:hypothetical protein PLICRDRAFT_700923 [Plicaturopsis crispa FD-325 SS-3]
MFAQLRVVFPPDANIGEYLLTNTNAPPNRKTGVAIVRSTISSNNHSSVYRASIGSQIYVIKLSAHNKPWLRVNDPSLPDLETEANNYRTKLYDLQGTIVPVFYGLFKGENRLNHKIGCMVLEDCGDSVDRNFYELDRSDRTIILKLLGTLHIYGLDAPDFAERNVVSRDGKFRLVDFHDLVPHECEYTGNLYEHMPYGVVQLGCQVINCHACDMDFWVPDETPHVYIGPIAVEPHLYPDQWTVDELLPDPSADIVLNQAVLMQWLRKYKRMMDKGIYMDVEEYRQTMPKLKRPLPKSAIRRSRRILKHI